MEDVWEDICNPPVWDPHRHPPYPANVNAVSTQLRPLLAEGALQWLRNRIENHASYSLLFDGSGEFRIRTTPLEYEDTDGQCYEATVSSLPAMGGLKLELTFAGATEVCVTHLPLCV